MGKSLRKLPGAMRGLRARIALLTVVTAVPLLGLLLIGTAIDRHETIRTAEKRVVDLARLGAERQNAMVTDAENLLSVVAQLPVVRGGGNDNCHSVLHQVADADPRIDSIVVAAENGDVTCNSGITSGVVNLADRQYFRQANSGVPGALSASGMVVSRLSGKLIVVVAVPINAAPAKSSGGVIAASLSLDYLSYLATRTSEGIDYVACIIDPTSGAFLAFSPERPALIGHRFPVHPLIKSIQQSLGGGSVITPDLGGVPRIFGFAPMRVGDTTLILAVGLSRAAVLTEADARLYWGLALALVATAMALGLGWYTARSALLRPIDSLAGTAARFGAGNLATRAVTRGEVTEIRTLSLAFNRMARRLQIRNRDLIATQGALRASEEYHRLLADGATDMITRFSPDFRRTYVSPACYELLGYRQDELLGREPSGIVHPDDWLLLDATLNAPLRAGHLTARSSFRAKRKDGSLVWLESNGRRLPSNAGYVVVTRDITERKTFEHQLEEANRQLEVLAMQDPLTGLSNRRHFDEMLHAEYRRAHRTQGAMSVIMIDADQFKTYNDIYGHPAGDECLRSIARAIERFRRPTDLAARYGGEEFAVLLPSTDQAAAVEVADRLKNAIRGLDIAHSGSPYSVVTASLGVAGMSPHLMDKDPAWLISAADRALYVAKASGRGVVRVASES